MRSIQNGLFSPLFFTCLYIEGFCKKNRTTPALQTEGQTDTIGYEVASLENQTKVTVFQNRKGKKEKGKVNKSDFKDRISFNKHQVYPVKPFHSYNINIFL